jgi:hypothetical protein
VCLRVCECVCVCVFCIFGGANLCAGDIDVQFAAEASGLELGVTELEDTLRDYSAELDRLLNFG